MGLHPVFRAGIPHWISTEETLEALGFWFSRTDILQLVERGFQAEAIEVARYRRLHFPTYSHSVYCAEDMLSLQIIDPMLPYKLQAA